MQIAIIIGQGKNFGSGHNQRSKEIINILQQLNLKYTTFFINKNIDILNIDLTEYSLVIKDARDCNSKIARYLQNLPMITFDDYYKYNERKYLYIYNSIPSLEKYGNIRDIKYSLISKKKILSLINDNQCNQNILITFGKKDDYFLTEFVLDYFMKITSQINLKNANIYVNKPNRNFDTDKYSFFIDFIQKQDEYENKFKISDIIITHFGLTAIEAKFAKKEIILFNPTNYHNDLVEKHFKKNNTKNDFEKFIKILKQFLYKKKNSFKDEEIKGIEYFKTLILYIIKQNNYEINCPICNYKKTNVMLREKEYNLYSCKKCKTLFRYDLIDSNIDYYEDSTYFFDSYKEVYGKTYFNDKENISQYNRKRINILSKHSSINNKSLVLDIGSAYGFFLDDLKDIYDLENKNIYASEINKDPVKKLVEKGYNLLNFDWNNDLITNYSKQFELITGWYVFEHFSNINNVFNNVSNLLKKNGLFCFSIPSIYGPTYKYNRDKYLYERPDEHYYDFSPMSLKILLKKHGFKILYIKGQKSHFSRFKKYSHFLGSLVPKFVYNIFVEKFKFSDTLEVYCKKL